MLCNLYIWEWTQSTSWTKIYKQTKSNIHVHVMLHYMWHGFNTPDCQTTRIPITVNKKVHRSHGAKVTAQLVALSRASKYSYTGIWNPRNTVPSSLLNPPKNLLILRLGRRSRAHSITHMWLKPPLPALFFIIVNENNSTGHSCTRGSGIEDFLCIFFPQWCFIAARRHRDAVHFSLARFFARCEVQVGVFQLEPRPLCAALRTTGVSFHFKKALQGYVTMTVHIVIL